jgi:t-SNARE complex subunit (syntaxin)
MEGIIRQAPINVSKETIKEIYEKNGGDATKTLMELWEIAEVPKKAIDNIQENWKRVRETCDDFDGEMNKMMDVIRAKRSNKINTE